MVNQFHIKPNKLMHTEEYWQEISSIYDDTRYIPPIIIDEFAHFLLEKIKFVESQKSKILDAGIGTGRLAIPLSNQLRANGITVVGFDNSPVMLKKAKAKINTLIRVGIRIPNLLITFEDVEKGLSYRNGTFDLCLLIYFLNHLKNWKKSLDELVRVLKPNGLLVFSTINGPLHNGIEDTLEFYRGGIDPGLREFWQYYHSLRKSLLPSDLSKREILATNYTPALNYLNSKGYSITQIKAEFFSWSSRITWGRLIKILYTCPYTICRRGLSKKRQGYLAKEMEKWVRKKRYNIRKSIFYKSYLLVNIAEMRLKNVL